jgi:hypothetical protein
LPEDSDQEDLKAISGIMKQYREAYHLAEKNHIQLRGGVLVPSHAYLEDGQVEEEDARTSYVPFMDSTLFQKNALFPTAANQAPVLVTSPAVGPWNKVDVG